VKEARANITYSVICGGADGALLAMFVGNDSDTWNEIISRRFPLDNQSSIFWCAAHAIALRDD
jgi:hypothetical protein